MYIYMTSQTGWKAIAIHILPNSHKGKAIGECYLVSQKNITRD